MIGTDSTLMRLPLKYIIFEFFDFSYQKEKKIHGSNFSLYNGYRHPTGNYSSDFLQEMARREQVAEQERQRNRSSNSSMTNNGKDL